MYSEPTQSVEKKSVSRYMAVEHVTVTLLFQDVSFLYREITSLSMDMRGWRVALLEGYDSVPLSPCQATSCRGEASRVAFRCCCFHDCSIWKEQLSLARCSSSKRALSEVQIPCIAWSEQKTSKRFCIAALCLSLDMTCQTVYWLLFEMLGYPQWLNLLLWYFSGQKFDSWVARSRGCSQKAMWRHGSGHGISHWVWSCFLANITMTENKLNITEYLVRRCKK